MDVVVDIVGIVLLFLLLQALLGRLWAVVVLVVFVVEVACRSRCRCRCCCRRRRCYCCSETHAKLEKTMEKPRKS